MFSNRTRWTVQEIADEYRGGKSAPDAAVAALRQHVPPEEFEQAFQFLPADLVSAVRRDLLLRPPPKAVGYWWSPDEPDLPDPTLLVGPPRDQQERDRISAYLRAGQVYEAWRGLSWCRFRCGIDDSEMGSRCLTDGKWVWPEGLAHYIEHHDIRLPEEFIETMRAHDWTPDPNAAAISIDGWKPAPWDEHRRADLGMPDGSFWRTWAAANADPSTGGPASF